MVTTTELAWSVADRPAICASCGEEIPVGDDILLIQFTEDDAARIFGTRCECAQDRQHEYAGLGIE